MRVWSRAPRRAAAAGVAAAALAAVAGGVAVSGAGAAGGGTAEKPSQPHRVFVRRTFGSGGWSWFADPRAVYADGHIIAAWVDQDRYVTVASIRSDSVYRVRIAREHIEDDHGNPALLVRPDGRITAYYSDHNGSSMRYRTTSHAGLIDKWGSEHKLPDNTSGSHGFTYPNPVYLSDPDRTYLFWRGADWSMAYAFTGPNGFSSAHRLVARHGARPYTKVATNGRDEIYLAFTNGHPREVSSSVFFATYRDGALYRADGSRIASSSSFPIRPGKASHVYMTSEHGGVRAWVHDVAMGQDGKPVVVYATFRDGGRRHRYEYARYTGHHWSLHPIVSAGGSITDDKHEKDYSGGVVLDHSDPRIVYASVKSGSHWEIGRWVTDDGGASFTRKWITRDSGTDNVRPVVPRDLPPGKKAVLWMRGHYVFYTDFRTAIVGTARRR